MTTTPCTLCELPVAGTEVADGAGNRFCCEGCRHVHAVLGDLDDVGADDVRERVRERPPARPIPSSHVTTYLAIDGMYCSTCEAFIESVGANIEGVSDVETSYITETARVTHDPEVAPTEALEAAISRLGYSAYPRDDDRRRREAADWAFGRLAAGVLIGMAVMLQYVVIIYPTYFDGLWYDERTAQFFIEALASPASRYFFAVIGVMTTVVLVFTGKPILRGAYVSVRTRTPNMDLLVAIAALSAYGYSWLAIAVGRTDIYFDVSVAIILVVTAGSYHASSLKARAMEQLTALTRVRVDAARRVTPAGEESVDLDELEAGDRVLVRAGERVPVDGTVATGTATVDEGIITGEARPVAKRRGDAVIGGSVVDDGAVTVAVGEDATSSLDRITELVWSIQSRSHGIQGLANTLATIFVPLVLVLAIAIAAVNLGLGAGVATALLVGLTVLIVSCPCALGLATPLAVAAGLRDALANGIVVFDETVFERIRHADTVVFDKTGTLTTGEMRVIEAEIDDATLAQAAALERRSVHPVGRAIVALLGDGGGSTAPRPDGGVEPARVATGRVEAFETHDRGVSGFVDGDRIVVGHPDLLARLDVAVDPDHAARVDRARERGDHPVLVARNGRTAGTIVLGDRLREGWAGTFQALADAGVDVVVLTGDEGPSATRFAAHDAVTEVFAGVPPEAKAATIERLSAEGVTVMVGEGTNDAPALAQADLGIALGSGTALAADAADVAIIDDDLSTVTTVFDLARAANGRTKQNLGWAFAYNGIAIPLAITGLLNPLFAAIAMATSSILVVSNSSRRLLPDRR